MKKILLGIVVVFALLLTFGCQKKPELNKDAIEFKNSYESINGKTNSKGVQYRKLNIPNDNPFVTVTAADIVKKIENKESFYVYFGDKQCPWCRSVIEKFIEVANKKKINKIYYVAIWDDDHNEILRDTYTLDGKKINQTNVGTGDYYKLLEYFGNVLADYTLTSENNKKVSVGEKRIYAPNFIYVEEGNAVRMVEGMSELQSDPYEDLSDEMLEEEEKKFDEFLVSSNTCDKKEC